MTPATRATGDGKPCGTYIEVEGYYISNTVANPGKGKIIYRFMLGKDTERDYNAERNFHYKLTLRFRGHANDVDWHIEYDEDEGIYAPNPYYISYLYDHEMMLPLKIKGHPRRQTQGRDRREQLAAPRGRQRVRVLPG